MGRPITDYPILDRYTIPLLIENSLLSLKQVLMRKKLRDLAKKRNYDRKEFEE